SRSPTRCSSSVIRPRRESRTAKMATWASGGTVPQSGSGIGGWGIMLTVLRIHFTKGSTRERVRHTVADGNFGIDEFLDDREGFPRALSGQAILCFDHQNDASKGRVGLDSHEELAEFPVLAIPASKGGDTRVGGMFGLRERFEMVSPAEGGE